MSNVGLLALLWITDPSVTHDDTIKVNVPIATCARPAVMVVEALSSCAAASVRSLQILPVESWLVRWELASRSLPICSRTQREEFRRLNEGMNEHTLAAAERLSGRVSARSLNESYRWKIRLDGINGVALEGIPRDEMESLFYTSVELKFRIGDAVPSQLVIVGRDPHQRTVWEGDGSARFESIEFVYFETELPPAPMIHRQTASRLRD